MGVLRDPRQHRTGGRDGRAPRTDDEVALGAKTLGAVHRSVGDTVRVAGASGSKMFRIVGQAAFPSLSDPEPLADGAVFTARRTEPSWRQSVVGTSSCASLPGRTGGAARARGRAAARASGATRVHGSRPRSTASARSTACPSRSLPSSPSSRSSRSAAPRRLRAPPSSRARRAQDARASRVGRSGPPWRGRRRTVAAIGLLSASRSVSSSGAFVWRRVADELGVSPEPTWPVARRRRCS